MATMGKVLGMRAAGWVSGFAHLLSQRSCGSGALLGCSVFFSLAVWRNAMVCDGQRDATVAMMRLSL